MSLEPRPMRLFDWQREIRGRMPSHVIPVALMLSTYADAEGGGAYPGAARLAEDCSCSLKTVQRSVKWLQDHHFLILLERGNSRAGKANVWQLAKPIPTLDLEPLPASEYAAYMRSPMWGLKARAYYSRYKRVCRNCESRQTIELHHLTYDRLGCEPLTDLIALCHDCHMTVHSYAQARAVSIADATAAVVGHVEGIRRSA